MSQERQSFLSHFKKTLQPNGQLVPVNVAGSFILCSDVVGSALPFEVQIDSEPFVPITQGLSIRLRAGDSFSKLTLRNPTDKVLTVEFYVGSSHVDDARLNIVRGRSAPVMNAPTVMTAHSTTIAAAAALDLTGAHPTFPKYLRKATIITNMDPAVDLELVNAADDIIATVMFRTAFLLESSEGIKVKNNSAGNVVCRAVQVWYIVEVE
ncbi:MAG: hypothetical protein KIS67_20270 [Verrucomicrobiae bacterium]|nr:hypothetical protein [Verrucomicrobiae bacterium]